MSTPAADVVVVGGGAIGLAVSLELAERGTSVTLLDRLPEVGLGCSYGNAGVLGTTHVVPLASRAALREGLVAMRSRTGPVSIAPTPAAVPWAARFVAASAPRRYAAGAAVLADLATESAALHEALHDRLGTTFTRKGFLGVYAEPRAFAQAQAHVPAGLDVTTFDGPQTRERQPQLAVSPAGSVLTADDAHCDPRAFTSALAVAATAAGVRIRTGVEVTGLRRRGRQVTAVATSVGDIAAGHVVLATGVWARELLPGLPILGGRGYHIDYPSAPGDVEQPTWFLPERVVATPLPDRLRITGVLQVVSTGTRPDQPRIDAVRRHAERLLRGLAERRPLGVWSGMRPCTPDGLPIIGPLRSCDNLTLATGHGMWGLQLAPVTGRLVADLVTRSSPGRDLRALRPERFRAAR